MRTEPAAGLAIGGVDANELAARYGTPLLALDTDVLDASIARFARAHATYGVDVSYAAKALLFVALARRLAATPLGLDVCSLGELLTAERGAFPAARLVMHGCGKTDEELRAAADGRVARVVLDHTDEIARLAPFAHPERPVTVLLRVNTGIAASTHAYVRTGGESTKFGLALGDVAGAVEAVLATPSLRFAGFHSHLGSQIFDEAPYAASLDVLLDLAKIATTRGAQVADVVLGGGFGVAQSPTDEDDRIDIDAIVARLARTFATGARERGLVALRLGIEPGRAIVARAGTSLYRVVAVKRQGARRFAIVDGGIADNPRPALYGAVHPPSLANRTSDVACEATTVCGRSCENDELVTAALPLDLRAGDLLALGTTGAYTYSMASNYNRFPRPAIVFAGGGAHALVVRRESSDDTLRNDVA